jgi:2-amino-4-hydroxy-6-hydroxymethyldihydropteridine diphosphokinase
MRYFLGLGSNLSDGAENLGEAIRRLKKAPMKVVRASSVYFTEPVGMTDQPWFINQVLEIETNLTPWGLLVLLQSIEKKMGRTKRIPKGPRIIDLDILLAGDTMIVTPDLTIPHPRMALRNFVLIPLAEIAPRAVHPILRKSVATLSANSLDRSIVQRIGYRRSRRGPRK